MPHSAARSSAAAVAATALVFTWSTPGRALEAQKSISQLTHTAWSAKDGIPGPVRAIRQTADGYLWLGTEAGLYRFDGIRFVPWASAFGERLPSASVWSLCAAHDGSLWIGLGSSGISQLRGGRLTNYLPGDGVPGGGVLSIVEDAAGSIWAGGQYGFSKYEDGIWRAIGADDGYPAPGAQALLVDHQGTVWAATDGFNFGLSTDPVKRNTILTLTHNDKQFKSTGEALGLVWTMAEGPNGDVWIADTSARTTRPVTGRTQAMRQIAPDAEPLCVLFDDSKRLWVGLIEHGMVATTAYDRPKPTLALEQFGAKDGLSGDLIYSMFKDREGNIWVGTAGGLDRFRENKVTAFSAREGLDPDQQIAVTSAAKRGMWVVSYTRDAVRLFRDGHFVMSQVPAYSPSDTSRILSLFADHAGNAWVGGSFKLAKETNGRFSLAHFAEIESGANVEAIALDTGGSLWIAETRWDAAAGTASAPKVLRLQNGTWTDFSALGVLPKFKSRVLYADAEQRVWLGFENGAVAEYDKGVFHTYSVNDGLPRGRVFTITGDRKGNIWVGGEGGLSRFVRGRFATLSTNNGLPGNSVSGVVEDDQGSLWLACALGILRVSHEELDKALASPSYRMRGLTIGASDGLRGLPRQKEPFPTVARADDGRLWFATTGGVAVIDPTRLPTNPVPPPVIIETIKADDRLLVASSALRLPPRTRNLDITYAALSLTDPERVEFRYQLEGYDEAWRGPITARQLTYTNLPPGPYRFRLKASNNDGLWNEEGAALEFSILPALYQTSAFRLSTLLLLAFSGWVAYRLHLRQVASRLNLRYEERLAERERIARELHDTLLQGAYGLMLRFQAVADQIPPTEPARRTMDEALDRADRTIADGRNRVEGLRTIEDRLDLAEALTRVGNELAPDSGTEVRVIVEGRSQALHAIVRDEVYWISREALVNAFHAATASHVEVELIYGRHELRLLCRDDGRGIDPAVLKAGGRPGHWGIRGMRERATRIGARLEISSRLGAGTEVDLRIPGTVAYRLPVRQSWKRFRLGRVAIE